MGKILSASEGLIDPAFDKFLDGNPTRRELQATFHKIGVKMTEVFEGLDTQALVGNFLCEKLGVTRAEIEVYVQKKAEEIKTQIEAQKKAAQKSSMSQEGTQEVGNEEEPKSQKQDDPVAKG